MDVMVPELFWIGDRCYRLPVLDSKNSCANFEQEYNETELNYDCADKYDDEVCDDVDDLEELIEVLGDNRFKLRLPISQAFWSKIIGTKGVTKKRIECDTQTTILIPRPTERGDIVIKGSSKSSLILAKKSIDAIVSSARQKLVFTHFISIPMNNGEIKKNFISFKDEVLQLYGGDRGVEESIFQNPEKLHLTVCTLVLTDQSERKMAEKRLSEAYEKFVKPLLQGSKNVSIEMKGIEYMNDDPAEVDVLYGKISTTHDSDILQKIADSILGYFSCHRLIKCVNEERVKLHVTLMNTLFRDEEPEEMNEEGEGLGKTKWNKKIRKTFNATNILQKFQNFYFGVQELKNIQLSVRFSTAKDGYYRSSCVINI